MKFPEALQLMLEGKEVVGSMGLLNRFHAGSLQYKERGAWLDDFSSLGALMRIDFSTPPFTYTEALERTKTGKKCKRASGKSGECRLYQDTYGYRYDDGKNHSTEIFIEATLDMWVEE